MSDGIVKLSVNLSEEVVATLRELARKRGTTMTDVIRHAISLDKFVQDQVDGGSKVLVERGGEVREVLVIR